MSNHHKNWVGYPVKVLGAITLNAGASAQSSGIALSQGQTAPGGFNTIVAVGVPLNFLK